MLVNARGGVRRNQALDSVTQAALGAAVGVAVMQRKQPLWKSALLGATLGTLPDLDVLIDKGGPIRNIVLHRAETHAIFWQSLAAPVFAAGLVWVTRTRIDLLRWTLMVWLVFVTHALCDAMTVYGTRLGLPFTDYPFGLNNLFIIDPLYTLPLLMGLTFALMLRKPSRLHWNTAGLAISSAYAVWALAAQLHVTQLALSSLEAQGASRQQVLVSPTPFNTLLWRIVVRQPGYYDEGFYSLLDPAPVIHFTRFDRGQELDTGIENHPEADLVRKFSKGFYSVQEEAGEIRITDLRMGQHPFYVFSFTIAERQMRELNLVEPKHVSNIMPLGVGLRWLWRRIQGELILPPRDISASE